MFLCCIPTEHLKTNIRFFKAKLRLVEWILNLLLFLFFSVKKTQRKPGRPARQCWSSSTFVFPTKVRIDHTSTCEILCLRNRYHKQQGRHLVLLVTNCQMCAFRGLQLEKIVLNCPASRCKNSSVLDHVCVAIFSQRVGNNGPKAHIG